MNRIKIGFSNSFDNEIFECKENGFLLIADEIPKLKGQPRIFDPGRHHFNPLTGLTRKAARELAVVLFSLYPQGENTLRVRDARIALAPALIASKRLDKMKTDNDDVLALADDLLFSPVLKRVLCTDLKDFSFNPKSVILARINRAELGEFDALALTLFLIAHYKGQLIVPTFGFSGRDVHTNLILQNRLIAGIHYFDELPLHLRRNVLSVTDIEAHGALYDDAVLLAKFAGLITGTNGFNEFVDRAMAPA